MMLPVDPTRYVAFLGVMLVMAITPGPANLFAVATGLEKGKRAAVIGVLGMCLATSTWFLAAALGLGALVTAFPTAFRLIALAGAAYVAWLGIGSILGALHQEAKAPKSGFAISDLPLKDGFLVQIANPKAILFFTAVLPPFLDIQRPIVPQLIMFACATLGLDFLAMSAYGISGAALSKAMNEAHFRRIFGLGVGALLITAAALMALRH